MADRGSQDGSPEAPSSLAGPPINPEFEAALDELVAVAGDGHKAGSRFFNPSDEWLVSQAGVYGDLSSREQASIMAETRQIDLEAEQANAEGKAAPRAGPDVAVPLSSGGLAFYSQLGVVRRPDLTMYFIDGFDRNRDGLAFDEDKQALFTDVFRNIALRLKEHFASGETVVQSDRQICDAPGRSFHARQLLFGAHYVQIPLMWRQLTFDLPEEQRPDAPDILEVSIPDWLNDLGLSEELKERIGESGVTQLIFKAPTKGLSLHLGFDYVGEHKMGPLSIAMHQVKQANGIAIQAALSVARARSADGSKKNTALVTIGPSLHGKSTLTIMMELADSELGRLLGLSDDSEEGIYPMNDDIVLVRPLEEPVESARSGGRFRISHGIDGTENNFYAMPFGVSEQDDPITYDAIRGSTEDPNTHELLENIPTELDTATPNFLENPVRNMRAVLSRSRLRRMKNVDHLLAAITRDRVSESAYVPMEDMDRVFWQAVMRQNTVIPPLRKLSLEQYVRVLMYGEAVQMGAAIGAIGRPYVEYLSDPFIIGLENENANLMHHILQQMAWGGMPQEFYVFNTGGVGADSDEEASGALYKKISKDLTLTLQEALLRDAVKFEFDGTLRSDVAVAVVNSQGDEVLNLREDWLPSEIYGRADYTKRVTQLLRRRYYGLDATDKAGILRYTKVSDAVIDLADIPPPQNERELTWLLSYYWHVGSACNSAVELAQARGQGRSPLPHILRSLQRIYETASAHGLDVPAEGRDALRTLGFRIEG